jgi:hypothetical protein
MLNPEGETFLKLQTWVKIRIVHKFLRMVFIGEKLRGLYINTNKIPLL